MTSILRKESLLLNSLYSSLKHLQIEEKLLTLSVEKNAFARNLCRYWFICSRVFISGVREKMNHISDGGKF